MLLWLAFSLLSLSFSLHTPSRSIVVILITSFLLSSNTFHLFPSPFHTFALLKNVTMELKRQKHQQQQQRTAKTMFHMHIMSMRKAHTAHEHDPMSIGWQILYVCIIAMGLLISNKISISLLVKWADSWCDAEQSWYWNIVQKESATKTKTSKQSDMEWMA